MDVVLDQSIIGTFRRLIMQNLGYEFLVQTFWDKYSGLLEAVRVEEFYIISILQVIVLVSIFNIVALLFFISEKKSPQLFLLQVLGMGGKQLNRFWYKAVSLLWIVAVAGSLILSMGYRYALQNLDIFKVPGSVYHLSRFDLSFNWLEVIIIFILVLVAMLVVTWWSMHRRGRVSLITKMRQL
jgi:ABC-type lipoprotein release transport system permease subunit